MSVKLRVLLFTLALTLPADQLSKAWVNARVPRGVDGYIALIDGFFSISHVRNAGAAFGLIREWPWAWRMAVFSLMFAMGCTIVVVFYRALAPGDRINACALGLILSGACGNWIDRVLRGEVIDFLHFDLWRGYAWPDFNLADMFIVVGVCTLMVELLASEGESRGGPTERPTVSSDADDADGGPAR
jgi:signal peptidase II